MSSSQQGIDRILEAPSAHPSLADLPVYKGDVNEELRLLRKMARFNRSLALKALLSGDVKNGAIALLQGIGFYRCWELPLVDRYFRPGPGTRILDVGSLKSFLPLYWALRGCQVTVIDIDPRVKLQERYAHYLGRADLLGKGLRVAVQDGTSTDLPSSSFDLITNISAVEHFTGDGDIQFVQEAARLLKAGGRLFLSFGIGPEYREWRWEWLFCRTYNGPTLWRRLVEPSGLEVEATMYFESGRTRQFSRFWYRFPLIVRNGILGWMQRPIYQVLYRREHATADNANYFGIVLRKGENT